MKLDFCKKKPSHILECEGFIIIIQELVKLYYSRTPFISRSKTMFEFGGMGPPPWAP